MDLGSIALNVQSSYLMANVAKDSALSTARTIRTSTRLLGYYRMYFRGLEQTHLELVDEPKRS